MTLSQIMRICCEQLGFVKEHKAKKNGNRKRLGTDYGYYVVSGLGGQMKVLNRVRATLQYYWL